MEERGATVHTHRDQEHFEVYSSTSAIQARLSASTSIYLNALRGAGTSCKQGKLLIPHPHFVPGFERHRSIDELLVLRARAELRGAIRSVA